MLQNVKTSTLKLRPSVAAKSTVHVVDYFKFVAGASRSLRMDVTSASSGHSPSHSKGCFMRYVRGAPLQGPILKGPCNYPKNCSGCMPRKCHPCLRWWGNPQAKPRDLAKAKGCSRHGGSPGATEAISKMALKSVGRRGGKFDS